MLFSGEDTLAPLIQDAGSWTVGALILLIVCKGLAYALSLSAFRGGPTFPGMFIGAAGGIALSHLAGLPMIAGAGMGIGAMTVVMLGMPLTSVLLASTFLAADSLTLMPLIIVAVVVAYVASVRLTPVAAADGGRAGGGGPTAGRRGDLSGRTGHRGAQVASRRIGSVLLDGAAVDAAVGELEPLDGGVAAAAVLAAVDVEAVGPGELGHGRARGGEAGVGRVDGDDAAEAHADGQERRRRRPRSPGSRTGRASCPGRRGSMPWRKHSSLR